METQPLLLTDLPQLKDLQPADWSDIIPYFNFYITADFCSPVKVVTGNSIAGVGTVIQHKNIAWLAHIIVHPEHRNKGLGRLLTQELVHIAEAKGAGTINLIATDLGAPVYEKVGFSTETDYLFYKDIKPDPAWAISANIVPYSAEFKDQVALLDKQISGEDRFFHVEQYLQTGFLCLQENKVEGFYLPGFADGVILAATPVAGTELMKLRLLAKETASFPVDNVVASDFMKQLGLQPHKQAKRMSLGRPISWQPQHIYNRIGGNLG